ncbi:MAG: hypothetical protein NC218_12095 [Acetobacter sp.]|nr:hypothetical protein [Acetobacter sp.]
MFLLICHRSERSEVKRSRESMGATVWRGRSLDSGSGAGCPRGMTRRRCA